MTCNVPRESAKWKEYKTKSRTYVLRGFFMIIKRAEKNKRKEGGRREDVIRLTPLGCKLLQQRNDAATKTQFCAETQYTTQHNTVCTQYQYT